jgi:hypothetical protein
MSPIDPYDLADKLGVNIGPRPKPMNSDEIRAALDAMMSAEPCEHCGAPVQMVFRRGLTAAETFVEHDDGCPEAAA